MKAVLGIIMILFGAALGLYLGLWVCLVCSIVDIINELKKPGAVDALVIGWSVVKLIFASFVGWGSAMLLIIPGLGMLHK